MHCGEEASYKNALCSESISLRGLIVRRTTGVLQTMSSWIRLPFDHQLQRCIVIKVNYGSNQKNKTGNTCFPDSIHIIGLKELNKKN